jgi:2-polyprenyl-3-methyl-5-hydroxy-6-metoxy-1,4-benzoquinol methylase/glycosyltransferase involved in cell wall biosynthesis
MKCYICGNLSEFQGKENYSLRESTCSSCGSSRRQSDLAKVILETFLPEITEPLKTAAEKLSHLSILEAQSTGPVHETLRGLPHYICSEYFDDIPAGQKNASGILCQNPQNLTFPSDYFDLVISQDVFEHIAEPQKAFCEIQRVLKPGGFHIFTVPYHDGRPTISRIVVKDGKERKKYPDVYHDDALRKQGALVYTDFGSDLPQILNSTGFDTQSIPCAIWYSPSDIPSILNEKEYQDYIRSNNENKILEFFKYNSWVFRSQKKISVGETSVLEWTGERYLPYLDPTIAGAEIHYEHLHRYAFATQFVKGKRVLDLACGEGYGSFLCAKHAECVVGIDIDPVAVHHASNTYTLENLKFIQGSILDIPIKEENTFDVIICFEAIEHVTDHETLFSEIKRLLKKEGILIISSPNKSLYTDVLDNKNPFHKKELYYPEFRNLLKNNFSSVALFGQRILNGSSIYPLIAKKPSSSSEFFVDNPGNKFSFSDHNKKNSVYFVAIASDIKIENPSLCTSYLVDQSNTEIALLNHRIAADGVTITTIRQNLSDKDQQISGLTQVISDKDQQISGLTQVISDKDQKISGLTQVISEKDQQVSGLTQVISEKDQQISGLCRVVSDKDQQVSGLTQVISEKDQQISGLCRVVSDKDQQVSGLSEVISDKDQQISSLKKISNSDKNITLNAAEVERLNGVNRGLVAEIRKQNARSNSLAAENHAIKQSTVYSLTQKFDKAIINPIFPPESRRRNYYTLMIKAGRILVHEGPGGLLWQYHERKKHKRMMAIQNITVVRPDVIPPSPSHMVQEIDTTVSIVIPTKNAGTEFRYTLENIRQQKGISHIEIITIDTGSSDKTLEIAENYQASIYSIPADQFNHGRTRNIGASHAHGEYILFIVQDAIPAGDFWLYNLVNTVRKENVVAASCRQVPKSDADLFAACGIWNHYRILDFTGDHIFSLKGEFQDYPFKEKRRMANLDDVCSIVKKDIFDKYQFNATDYAEDLDLGARLVKDGHSIAFLHSVAVIHSHNRDAGYFLKRGYVDNKNVFQILDHPPHIDSSNPEIRQLYHAMMTLYAALNASIRITRDRSDSLNTQSIELIKTKITLNFQNPAILSECRRGCPSLDHLFDRMEDRYGPPVYRKSELLGTMLISILDDLALYLQNIRYQNETNDEFFDAVYKYFASVAGALMAQYYLHALKNSTLSEDLTALDNLLREGV